MPTKIEKERPVRVLFDKKRQVHYIKDGKRRIILEGYEKISQNKRMNFITKIYNNLSSDRKKRRYMKRSSNSKLKKASSDILPNRGSAEPSQPYGGPLRNEIMRDPKDPFSLMLPNFLLGKFNSYNQFEEMQKELKALKAKANTVLPIAPPIPIAPPLPIAPPPVNNAIMPPQPPVVINLHGTNYQVQPNAANHNIGINHIPPNNPNSTLTQPMNAVPNLLPVPPSFNASGVYTVINRSASTPVKPKPKPNISPAHLSMINSPVMSMLNTPSLNSISYRPSVNSVSASPFTGGIDLSSSLASAGLPSYNIDDMEDDIEDEEDKKHDMDGDEEEEDNTNEEDENKQTKPAKTEVKQKEVKVPENDEVGALVRVNKKYRVEDFDAIIPDAPPVPKGANPIVLAFTDSDGNMKAQFFDNETDFTHRLGKNSYILKSILNDKEYHSRKIFHVINRTLINQIKDMLGNRSAKDFKIGNYRYFQPAGRGLLEMSDKKGKYNTGLYDDELVEILTPYKDFVGVIMRDEIDDLLKRMMDEEKESFGFIMNLDKSDKEGSHWVAIYVDSECEREVDYYDSFGRPLPRDTMYSLKRYIGRLGLPWLIKFKSNRVVHQASESNRCGYHASRFLIGRFKGQSFEDATDFDTVKEAEGEAKIYEKDYREFGYI